MQQFIIRRLLNMLLVLLLSSIISFIAVELPPGDYASVLRGQLQAERIPRRRSRLRYGRSSSDLP